MGAKTGTAWQAEIIQRLREELSAALEEVCNLSLARSDAVERAEAAEEALKDIRDADAEMLAPEWRSFTRAAIKRALEGGG